MDLSIMMHRMLTEYCKDDPMPQDRRPTPTRWGGRWHCPLDGTLMSAPDYLLPMCPTCDRILPGDIVYQLIEVHQHR
ncbi:MAG: hypothetical protein AB7Q27_22310 [Acidimicrobiia bacterium]